MSTLRVVITELHSSQIPSYPAPTGDLWPLLQAVDQPGKPFYQWDGSAWTAIGLTPLSRYLGPVVSRSALPGAISTPQYLQSENIYYAVDDISQIMLTYAMISGQGENYKGLSAGTNGWTEILGCAVGYRGVWYQIRFAASPAKCMFGDILDSLLTALPVTIRAGDMFLVRTYSLGVAHTDGTNFGNMHVYFDYSVAEVQPANKQRFSAAPMTDLTLGGDLTTVGTAGAAHIRPAAIFGYTSKHTFCYAGDSRARGGNSSVSISTFDNYALCGELGLALSDFGVCNVGISGETYANATSSFVRRKLAVRCSNFISAWAINDLLAGINTRAELEAAILAFQAVLNLPTTPFWVPTATVRATSTDLYSTLANQTTHSTNADRIAFNNDVRCGLINDNTPVIPIEMADATESSRNSGKWKLSADPIRTTAGIVVTAGVGTTPGTATDSGAGFTLADHGKFIGFLTAGAGATAIVCQMVYVSTTVVKLCQPGTADWFQPAILSASKITAGTYSGLINCAEYTLDGLHPYTKFSQIAIANLVRAKGTFAMLK